MNLTQRRTQFDRQFLLANFVAIIAVSTCPVVNAADPLASWNEGLAKEAIVEIVAAVTDTNGKNYVEPAARVAAFDNDGTA